MSYSEILHLCPSSSAKKQDVECSVGSDLVLLFLIMSTEPCESCRGKFLLCFRDDGDGMEPCKWLLRDGENFIMQHGL